MPCLLKAPTATSPGIITFTHNEALGGLPVTSKRVAEFVEQSSRDRKWLFGVHVQGDCSHLTRWPVRPWHSFVMWPDPHAQFLTGLRPEQVIPLNCINFMPHIPQPETPSRRSVDICVISRAGRVKRIFETLQILRGLFDKNPDLTATLIVPDHRHFSEGESTYKQRDLDRRFFDLPLQMFSSKQLKNLSFICSSEESFGRFPLSNDLMTGLLRQSKLMLLTSKLEGTPRVIAEALMTGTPCALSQSMRTGIRAQLDDKNTLFVSDDIDTAVGQIRDALAHYERFAVDVDAAHRAFGEVHHLPQLREQLSRLIVERGGTVEGDWFLDELHLRLACHGQKHNSQFMHNEALFFDWFDRSQRFSPYDEDRVLGTRPIDDEPPFSATRLARDAAGWIYRRVFVNQS
jgi:glycosyltransferase involved in cell wall biosynthesis